MEACRDELAWFKNPIVRVGDLADGVAGYPKVGRRPGKRSLGEALRRLGFTYRTARVPAWNDGKPVSAWCAEWGGEPDSREPYETDAAPG